MTRDRLCRWFATCGGIGHLPFAPGTWASALTCAFLWLLPSLNNAALIAALTLLALPAVERARGSARDPGYIVIDELLGMLVTTVFHAITPFGLTKAFILFRAFDILKPYPIRKVERLPGAYGIIADDIAAGVYANAALFLWGRLV